MHGVGERLDRVDDRGRRAGAGLGVVVVRSVVDLLGEPGAAGECLGPCAERQDAEQLAGDRVRGVVRESGWIGLGAGRGAGIGHPLVLLIGVGPDMITERVGPVTHPIPRSSDHRPDRAGVS